MVIDDETLSELMKLYVDMPCKTLTKSEQPKDGSYCGIKELLILLKTL